MSLEGRSESKGAFPCIIVYSSIKHVEYINPILNDIEDVLKAKQLEPILLGDKVRSGDDYFTKLEELIDKSVLGIVILDGFRPNVLFEFGYLKGKGKPTIILKSSDAFINVKTLYDNDHGLTPKQFNSLKHPKIDLGRHFSDFVRHLTIFEWKARNDDPKHISNVLEEELDKYKDDIEKESTRVLTKDVSYERLKPFITNLVSSIFNAESVNLDTIKDIHKSIESLSDLSLSYEILRTIADAYVAVADRSHQLDVKSKVDAYKSALQVCDEIIYKFKDKEVYAETQFKIGYLYNELITYEGLEKQDLIEKTIQAYQEALSIYTKDAYPLQYAMTQNNLGAAYQTLAEIEDKDKNCKKAIDAYQEALEIVKDIPNLYQQIKSNLEIAREICR